MPVAPGTKQRLFVKVTRDTLPQIKEKYPFLYLERGRMKLWFIEPRPNVFVAGIKDAVAKRVIEYLLDHCPEKSGMTIIQRIPTPVGVFPPWGGKKSQLRLPCSPVGIEFL